MYLVMIRDTKYRNHWHQVSAHRSFLRAQETARKLTSAKYALRNVRTCHHRADVLIMLKGRKGRAPQYLGPQSHEF